MPKLKHLELQGYKTFATKTEFFFDEGITAIVGPNGSGKSNIADGIRWVLGEQSYRALRARQTADMIFHGSQQRARMGMASVTLTFDNSDGWLPVDFQEVSIARRAYRSGENEYLLNNTRVRLRDILELLAPTGLSRRTYTVIGQGLVDMALSLRPEERRLLFEEAAGIAAYKDKREEALRKLEETKANLLRVRDIINEITPRLSRLEKQAQRAQEYAQAQADLRALLRLWHGYRWRQALLALEEAEAEEKGVRQGLERITAQVQEVEKQIVALQERQAALRRQIGQWHRQSSELHRRAEATQRELAVCQERRRLLSQRREEIERELAQLRVRRTAQAGRVAATEAELVGIEERRQAQAAQVAEAQESLKIQQAALRQQRAEVERLREALSHIQARLAEREQRRQQLEARQRQLNEERVAHDEAHAAARAEAERWVAQVATIAERIASQQARIAELEAGRERRREELERSQKRQMEAAEGLVAAERTLVRLRDRLELLARLQEEGEGYAAGVRALLQARTSGIIGPVAECLRVPRRLERAVEAALGSHLQDLVVERWADAEAAIAWLKRKGAGRAAFLPLDSLRPPLPITPPKGPGIVGLASELVEAEERLRPAVALLLGRTIIVEDMSAARRVFEQQTAASASLQIVTLSGEIVHGDGRISGGSGAATMLTRERERRELPARLRAAEREVEAARAALARTEEDAGRCRAALAEVEVGIQKLVSETKDETARQAEAQRALDMARQREAWYRELSGKAGSELAELAELMADLIAERKRLQAQAAEQRAALAAAQEALSKLDISAAQENLAALQTELSVYESQRDGVMALLEGQREALAQIEEQIRVKEAQVAELNSQQEELEAHIAVQLRDAEALAAQIQGLASRLGPAEEELERLAEEQAELEAREQALRTELREQEARVNHASLRVRRCQDELQTLLQQIENELGAVDLEGREELDFLQPRLPLPLPAEKLPVVQQLPQGVEDDILRLRGQLRRLGRVNPNAPAEYQAALERHRFLTEQAADLEQAAQSLRQVIAELDQLMEREFERTFRAVAARFKEYFTTLFGGGSARLELTDPDDLTHSGVEIIARPPGRRPQSLALLSGGERSLTAIALIFAILKVSPTPFCVLDEVDAMLDEVNVNRFRALLKELSAETQFIVITHNRGTIEAADTIYGVSMGADSVSQVVSLKLHGERVAD